MKGRLKVILGGTEKSSGMSWWPVSSNLVSSTLSMASWEAWVLQQQQQQKMNQKWDQSERGECSASAAQSQSRWTLNLDKPERPPSRYPREVCRLWENRRYPRASQEALQTVGFPQLELWKKDFCPSAGKNEIYKQCVYVSCCILYCRLSLAGAQRAVITADFESTQHHSSCDQATEGEWVRGGDRWPGSDQYELKDKQTHFIQAMSSNMCTVIYCKCTLALLHPDTNILKLSTHLKLLEDISHC